ncbi:hypothetical protein ABZY03_14495 [Streptomyces klenkii]|uniref:hypothetical protein n=1 Tax=Streptomyces klenkii TaxID=1420899 RepID=UPI0033B70F4C
MYHPADPASPSSDDPGDLDPENAVKAVTRVITWYTRQILDEQRSPTPDTERLEQLQEQQRACVADRNRLADASPQEIARIATDYEARFKELDQS